MNQPTTLAGVQPGGERAHSRLNAEHYRVLGLSTLGGALEFYEFIIFIFLGVPLIPAQFTGVATPSTHAAFRATPA